MSHHAIMLTVSFGTILFLTKQNNGFMPLVLENTDKTYPHLHCLFHVCLNFMIFNKISDFCLCNKK